MTALASGSWWARPWCSFPTDPTLHSRPPDVRATDTQEAMWESATVGVERSHPGAPTVSVIVPAYNHERYVTDALNSVVDEGFQDLEVLVLDDGSTDDTWRRVQDWVAERQPTIPVWAARQSNQGLTRTLNRLLGHAAGKYVVAMASDDRLIPGGIAERVQFLESRPDLLAVFGDCRVIDADGRVTSDHGTGFGDERARARMVEDAAREIVERWSVPGPVLLYRREGVLAMGGYDESLQVEDWDLYLRLASRAAIGYLDLRVADYRWHGENIGARPDRAIELADELRSVAWRQRSLFRGHLHLELVHEGASLAARAAWLRRQRIRWAAWKATSVAVKLVAAVVPRRASDQKLAARRQ